MYYICSKSVLNNLAISSNFLDNSWFRSGEYSLWFYLAVGYPVFPIA